MTGKLREILPNPFTVDYQYGDEPLDLYTEDRMIAFAERIINECITIINNDSNAVEVIKERFGV